MKIITIGGKDYTLEYTIEASLYKDCVEKIYGFVMQAADGADGNSTKSAVAAISDVPQTALIAFYAGLMENHPEITGILDAKKLIKTYFSENKDNEDANFYGLLGMLIECMDDDGFFKQIGLTQAMNQVETPKKKKKSATKVIEM